MGDNSIRWRAHCWKEASVDNCSCCSHCSLWRSNNRTQHPLFRVPFGHTEKYPTRVVILGVLDFHGVLCPITHENCNCAAIQKYIRSRPLRTRKKTLENINRKSIMGYVFVCYPEKGSCIFARPCKEFSETPPKALVYRMQQHSVAEGPGD